MRRSYRRNPISLGTAKSRFRGLNVGGMVMPAAIAAAGAIASQAALAAIPVAALKTGPVRHLSRAALGVGVGMLAGGNIGKNLALGAMTISLHGLMQELIVAKYMPGLKLAEYSEDTAALGEYMASQQMLGSYDYTGAPMQAYDYSTEY